jgi:hypothetical protein
MLSTRFLVQSYYSLLSKQGEQDGRYILAGKIDKILVGKYELKRPLGKHIRRWEDNIKMDLEGLVCEGVDWIQLLQHEDQWRALEHGNTHLGFVKDREFTDS